MQRSGCDDAVGDHSIVEHLAIATDSDKGGRLVRQVGGVDHRGRADQRNDGPDGHPDAEHQHDLDQHAASGETVRPGRRRRRCSRRPLGVIDLKVEFPVVVIIELKLIVELGMVELGIVEPPVVTVIRCGQLTGDVKLGARPSGIYRHETAILGLSAGGCTAPDRKITLQLNWPDQKPRSACQ